MKVVMMIMIMMMVITIKTNFDCGCDAVSTRRVRVWSGHCTREFNQKRLSYVCTVHIFTLKFLILTSLPVPV
jgi:hypothetical protein